MICSSRASLFLINSKASLPYGVFDRWCGFTVFVKRGYTRWSIFCSSALSFAVNLYLIGPSRNSFIFSLPSPRFGVAVTPYTYFAFISWSTSIALSEAAWWHSSKYTCEYSFSIGWNPSFFFKDRIIATSTIPVSVSCAPWRFPINVFLFLVRPDFVWYSGKSSLISRNSSKRLSHWFIRSTLSTSIRVLTLLLAIISQQTTVFPNAVAAWSIPVSFLSIVSTAGICESRKSPLKEILSFRPTVRLSSTSYLTLASSSFFRISSRSPRGITIYFPASLPR